MKKTALITAMILLSQTHAFAGSAQANLECVSASGKTKVEATFPGDSSESGVIFTIEDQQVAYMDKNMKFAYDLNNDPELRPNPYWKKWEKAQVVSIKSLDQVQKGKLSINVFNEKALFRLDAIAGTVKVKGRPGSSRGTLKAQVQGIDPRTGGPSKVIEVLCNYDYAI